MIAAVDGGARDGCAEGVVVFLIDQRLRFLRPTLGRQLTQFLRNISRRQNSRVVDRQQLAEPVVIRLLRGEFSNFSKWLCPNAVRNKHRPAAVFHSGIGRRYAQAFGLAREYSLNTRPYGGEPMPAPKLSLPLICHVLAFALHVIIISVSRLTNSASGNASSMRRMPVCGLIAVQIAVRAWSFIGNMCQ